MKGYVFVPILIVAMLISLAIYQYLLPDFIKLGGYLVPFLMMLSMLLFTFIVERLITLKKAQGRGDVGGFSRDLKKAVDGGQLDDAIDVCRKQGGCLANVVGAGLERFQSVEQEQSREGRGRRRDAARHRGGQRPRDPAARAEPDRPLHDRLHLDHGGSARHHRRHDPLVPRHGSRRSARTPSSSPSGSPRRSSTPPAGSSSPSSGSSSTTSSRTASTGSTSDGRDHLRGGAAPAAPEGKGQCLSDTASGSRSPST